MNENPARRLAIIYNTIIFVNLFIFAAVFTVLFFRQYSINRENALTLTHKDLLQRVKTTEYLLRNAAEAVTESKKWAENYVNAVSAEPSPSVLMGLLRRNGKEGCLSLDQSPPPVDYDYGNICDRNTVGKYDAEYERELNMALWLFDLKKISHYTPPLFKWSYYHSKRGFATVYPWSPTKDTRELSKPPEIVRYFLAEESASGGAQRGVKQDESSNKWGAVFLDSDAKGLRIANASPVYYKHQLIGVVSAVMNLSFLNESVGEPDFPNGRIYIVNNSGQIVSQTGINPEEQGKAVTLSDVFPAGVLGPVNEAVKSGKSRFEKTGDSYLFFEPLNINGWFMIKAVPESDILFHFRHDVFYYVLLIAVLMVFVMVMHVLLRRFFVRPAISFVDFIRSEAVEGKAVMPVSSKIWSVWFQKMSDIIALRTLTGNLPGAIFQMRLDGDRNINIPMVSARITELTDLKPEELGGGSLPGGRLIPASIMPEFMRRLDESEKTMRPFNMEAQIDAGNHDSRWVRYISRPRKLENGTTVWDGIILDVTDRRKAEEELKKHHDHLEELVAERTIEVEKKNEELRKEIEEKIRYGQALKENEERLKTLSKQVISSQDEERARLTRELHDDLGQQLAAILFQLVLLREKSQIESCDINQIEKMVKTAGSDLHRICRALKPMTLKQFGLGPALKLLVWDLMENYKKTILLSVDAADYNVDEEKAMSVYRICQEAVVNSIRHSGAGNIEVTLYGMEKELVLVVRDDGKGFDTVAASKGGGMGLETMSQRAKLCGGRLSVVSAVNEGTTVKVEIPIT